MTGVRDYNFILSNALIWLPYNISSQLALRFKEEVQYIFKMVAIRTILEFIRNAFSYLWVTSILPMKVWTNLSFG